MGQISIKVTPEFERELRQYMKRHGLKRKSDAVRQAVHEAVARKGKKEFDFNLLLGAGLKAPLNPNPRFKSEDDLWS
jgi:hypothetical protein